MRAMDSNRRGFRSLSGTWMPNSCSSALTMSGSAKESSRPESKSDSSAAGDTCCFEILRTISSMRACLSTVLYLPAILAHSDDDDDAKLAARLSDVAGRREWRMQAAAEAD